MSTSDKVHPKQRTGMHLTLDQLVRVYQKVSQSCHASIQCECTHQAIVILMHAKEACYGMRHNPLP